MPPRTGRKRIFDVHHHGQPHAVVACDPGTDYSSWLNRNAHNRRSRDVVNRANDA